MKINVYAFPYCCMSLSLVINLSQTEEILLTMYDTFIKKTILVG